MEINKNHTKKSQKGASMLEYALLSALISVVCIVAVESLGQKSSETFDYVRNKMAIAGSLPDGTEAPD